MFLLYLTDGERRYGTKPTTVYRRKRWAFQFSLEGTCSLLVQEGERAGEYRLKGAWMTVTGPECLHGWAGRPDDLCKVIVFQFDEAEYALRSIIAPDGFRCLPISKEEIETVQALHARCANGRLDTHFALLIYRIVASELALLALRNLPAPELGPPPDFGKAKVGAAIAWYETNLSSAPTISEVAEAIHLSPAHLRRLFHRIQGISPQAAFTQVQFERAVEMLGNPTLTLDTIATTCGFGGGSAFSRAFKKAFGVPPKEYRARLRP